VTTAPARSPLDGIVEFFTLSRAATQLTRMGEGRTRVANMLTLGRQRAEAAETLWSNGHTAEGLRLACAGLDATLDAAAQFATTMKLEDAPAVSTRTTVRRSPPPETREPTGEVPVAKDDGDAAPKPAETAEASASETEGAEKAATPEPEPTSPDEAATAEPVAALPVEGSGARWRAALLARATRPARIERVASAVVAMRAATLPTYDSEMSSANADLFQNVMDARHIVDAALGATVWTGGEMRWARARRAFGAALALMAVITGAYFALHEPEGTFVSASDVWSQSPTFVADMAVDGRADTAWLLPDRQTGWLEIRNSPGRHVESVQIINTANSPHHDRATQDYRLEIYAHGELARSFDGHFDWSDAPSPVVHEVGLDDVERVRFVVLSFHRTGGGLAELTVR
jgi:hypothetical protein